MKCPMLNRVIKAEKVEIVMEIQLMRRLHQVNAVFDFEVAKHTKFSDRSQPRIACSDLLGGVVMSCVGLNSRSCAKGPEK